MNNETKTLQRIFVPYTYVRDMELFTNCNKLGDTPPGTEMRKIGGTAFPTKNLGKTPSQRGYGRCPSLFQQLRRRV